MRKGKGKMKMLDRNIKYLSILIMILITFGFSASVHGEGGEIMWQVGDTPQAGKQEAHAMAVNSSNDYTVITGFSDQSATDDYYTVLIDETGSIVTNWPKTFDNSGGLDHAEAVIFDSGDNIIVSGHSQNSNGNFDFHTIKYNTSGTVLWERSYDAGVNGNDYVAAVAVDSSNNVYVGGYSQNASGDNDYTVIKYPAAGGVPLWVRTYNGASGGEDSVFDIAVTANGVAVTGNSQNASLDFDCVTIKYDLSGNLVWSSEQRYDGPGNGDDRGVAVSMDAAGNVVVAAISVNTNKDIYVVKYNSATGSIESGWPGIYDGGSGDVPEDIFIDSVAAGENVYIAGYHTFGDGSNGFYTSKHDSGGTLVWEDVFHSSGDNTNDDRAVKIVVDDTNTVDNSGAVFVTGSTFDHTANFYDFQTVKYTINTGKKLWQESFDGSMSMNDRTVGIGLTSDGDVIVAGWSEVSVDDYEYYAIKYRRGLLNRPTDLTATAFSTTRIDLAWTDNSSNEDGFKIERKTGDGGTWSEIYLGVTAGETSYNDIGLDNDTKYYYRVRAYVDFDNSNYSDEVYEVSTLQSYTFTPAWTYTFDNQETNEDKVSAIAVGPDYHPAVTGHSFSSLGTFDYYTIKIDRDTSNDIWNERYDGDQNGVDMPATICVDGNNDVVVSGFSYLYSPPPVDATTNDIYTLKYPSTGPPAVWSDQYNGPAGDDDRSVVVDVSMDNLNNHVIVGYGRNGDWDDDIYVIKYDTDGNILWGDGVGDPYNGGNNDYPVAAEFDPAGNVIVAGYIFNTVNSTYDYFTKKYNGIDGSELWVEIYTSADGNDFISGLDIGLTTQDGATATSGSTTSLLDITKTWAVNEWANYYLYMEDGNNAGVARKISSNSGTTLTLAAADAFDSPIVIGNSYRIVTIDVYVTGKRFVTSENENFFTIKYNGYDGSIPAGWPVSYNGYANGIDESVAVKFDSVSNEIVVAGTTYTTNGENDLHTIRYAADGSVVWERTLDRPDNEDFAVTMGMDSSGNVYVTGDTENGVSPTSTWDVISIQYDYLGAFVNGTIVNGTDGDADGATSIAINGFGEVFVGGYELNSNYDADYLVIKLDGDILQAPIPFVATIHYASVDFTWTDNSEDEVSYQLQRNSAATTCDGTWSDIYNSTGTAYMDNNGGTGLATGTTYCYRIRTVGASSSSRWVEKTVTTNPLPAPSGLTATALNSTDIYLAWTDTTTSEDKFNIERCDVAGGNCPGSAFAEIDEVAANVESYTDTTACAGTEYYYRVNSEKNGSSGWVSPWSNNDNATTTDILNGAYTPSDLATAWVSEVQINLEWTDNTFDETGFKIERCVTSSCTYAQIDTIGMDSSLVMLLNMDEGAWDGTADEAADSSGSGNDGTAMNGATTITGGQYGYAGTFDGSDDYVEVAHSAGLNILDDLTVELWFKPVATYDSSLTDYVVLLDRQWAAGTDSYFLGINSDGKLYMSSSGGSIQSTQTTWTAGTWYHVIVTYRDVSGVYSGEMYINGVLETLSVNSYDNMAGGTQVIGIGGSDRYDNFDGIIDRVAIYNRALTSTEADDRFNNKLRYSDTGVPDVSVDYTYRVRAYKTAAPGCGGEWNSNYSATASETSAILPPSDVTATAINTSRVDLTWTDNTASETGFKIYRCEDPCTINYGTDEITEVSAVTGQGGTGSYSDETACEGATYRYGMKAVNSSVPWSSDPSNEDTATTDTGYAPELLSATRVTESLADFQWTDNTSDETGYKIERCLGNLAACTSSFTIDGTTNVITEPTDDVMLLHMDELSWDGTTGEVNDSSGSGNNGTAVNQANTDAGGRVLRGGVFDGSGDYVSVPHSSSLEGSGDFTIELWIKPIDQNNSQGLVSKSGWRYLFALNDSGGNYRLAYYGGGWQYANTYTPYNAWNHVAVTFDGTNSITFYLNGQPDGTRTITSNQVSSASLLIGQWSNSYWYEGLMDEVAVYDRALTGDEILTRYKNGLQEILEGTATNAAGSTTTIEDSTKAWATNAWTGYYAYMETGANAGELRQITSNTSNTLTVAAFASNVVNGDAYRIVDLIIGTDSTGLSITTTYTYRVTTYKTAPGCAGGEWNSPPSDLLEITTTAPQEPTNLTANTINTTEVRLDWDDNTTSETGFEIWSCEGASASDCDEDLEFASLDSVGSDVSTYSDTTVCEYDNTTPISYYYRVKAVNTNPEWVETTWSNIDSATPDDYIAPSGLVATTVTEEQIDITWTDNTRDETSFKIERCSGDAVTCASGPFSEVGTLATIYGDLLVYHMDEASWGTVIDSSEGGNNDGTAYGGATTDPSGKFGRAGSFNGSSQYVTTPLNLDQSSSSPGVTMAVWVKPASTSSGWHHVISTDDDGVEWSLVRNAGTWYVYTGSTNVSTGFSVDVGEWQHLAAVFTPGAGVTFYKNGAVWSTASIGYNTDDRNVYIGRRSRDSNYYFDGLIDEVALYDSPLSFTEIYQLDEDQWKEDSGDIEDGNYTWMQDQDKSWAVDEWVDYYVVILTGVAAGESRKITSNTSDTLTIEPFGTLPDVDDLYEIVTYLKGDATGGTTTTVVDTGKNWTTDEWINYFVVMETGSNAGQMRKIISNTSDTLTIDGGDPFGSAVSSGNSYKILPYLQGAQSYGTEDSGTATGGTTLTVIDTAKTWTTNEWTDLYVLMETGPNVGEISQIASNTSDTLTVSTAFTNAVSSGDIYRIVTSQSFTKRFSDTGLTIGQTYSYRVRGYKNSTCAWPFEYSNIDDATIVPPAPTNLTAVSGGTTQIELEWTDNTETETGFKIFRCDGTCTPADPGDLLVEVSGVVGTGIRSYTDTTVAPGVCESQTYSYSIVATSSSPAWDSAHSNVDTATADSAPDPSGFTATPVSESEVDLSWSDNTVDENGFKIYRCVGSGCVLDTDPIGGDDLLTTVDQNFEGFTDTGLAPGTSYEYEVHAYKTATCAWDKSDAASASSMAVAAPVLTATAVNTTQIDLDWSDDNASETGFEIFRCDVSLCSPNDPGDLLATVGPDVTTYSDASLCNSTEYTYRLKPVNDGLSNNGGGCWTRKTHLTITDFQPNYPTKVEITTYDSDMQSDFSDIRFYDATAELELPYWIETMTDGVSATIYVKTLVNNDIDMYYGNSSATSSSDVERVYELYDDFQGTFIDTEKWEEIDPGSWFSQNDDLILSDAGSDGWTRALISRQTFDRADGKEIYISLTIGGDTSGSNYFMAGWEMDQLSSPSYTQLWHGLYWNNTNLDTYENSSNTGASGTYAWNTAYEMRIVLKAAGAKYYIKGGTFSDWTLVQETSTYANSPMRMAFIQNSHSLNVHLVKIQNYALIEPAVVIGSESGSGCFSFSTIWTTGPDSNEATDTTLTPVAPSNLVAATVSDTQTDLTWTDNTADETGFKIERCVGTSCTPAPPEIGTSQGYDPSLTMLLRMDESSWHGVSGEVIDSVGSNNGTAYFGANTTASGFDRAGSFDGSTDYVSVSTSTGVNPTDAITVGLWAKSDTTNWNATGTLASKRNAYILYPVSGTKEIRFYVYTTLQWYYTTFTTSVDLTDWHHYAGTYDGYEIKLYIDGSPVGTPTYREGGINADTGALYIGKDDGNSAYFDGLIDEVAIYDSALSDSAIQALVNQGIASNTLYSDTVSPSVSYCYQVRAYKTASGCAGGEWNSGYSNSTCQESPPATPASLTATALNSLTIQLGWDASGVSNELGFVIERKIWGGTYITLATIGPDIETYFDTLGLEPEQEYTYRIWAYNAEGDSDYSNEASDVTLSWQEGDDTCY